MNTHHDTKPSEIQMPNQTKAITAAKAAAKRARERDLQRAATWCRINNKKARCKEVTDLFPNVSQSAADRSITEAEAGAARQGADCPWCHSASGAHV